MPSVFSAFATRVFNEIGIQFARGFKILGTQRGSIPFSVNGQGYVGVGRSEASYPVHMVAPGRSSLAAVVTDNSGFWLALGMGNTLGVGAVYATGKALALAVNGTPLIHATNSFGIGLGPGVNNPSVAQDANLPGFTVNLDRGTSRADWVVRGNPANYNAINASSPADAKWMQFNVQSVGLARFRSINDANTAAVAENILTMALDTGNVGIATNSAGEKLDVSGNAYIRGRVGVNAADSSATGALLARGRSTDSGTAGRFTNAGYVHGTLGSAVTVGQSSIAGNAYSYLQATQAGATQVAPLHLNPSGGRVGIGPAVTPASATAAVNAGEIFWDGDNLYVAVGQNSIKRVGIATW